MPLASSPQQDITQLLGRRSLAFIPRDQLELLDKPDAWAVEFENKPHGHAHIPGHVLKTAQQAYRERSRRKDRGQTGDPAQDESSHAQVPASSTALDEKPASSPAENASPSPTQIPSQPRRQDGVPASSPRTCGSWSSSPPRSQPRLQDDKPASSPVKGTSRPSPRPSQPPKHPHVDSSAVRETPKAAPPKPPHQPAPPKPPRDLADDDDDDGSSSDQDDLEVALPQAQAVSSTPVNMAAGRPPTPTPRLLDNKQTVPTSPPCAQPSQAVLVPATAARNATSCPPKPLIEGRRRRHKLIELGDSPVKPAASAMAGRRMPSTNMFLDGLSASSHYTTSSSLVPATCPDASVLSRVMASIESSDPAAGGPRLQLDGDVAQPTLSGRAMPTVQSVQAWATEPITRETNPYKSFVAEYPDYAACHGGSLSNFVRACVCIDYLRSQRLLRECLFDDFIRAFSVGYLQYVGRAGPGQDPLPAIEWFNLLGGVPLYSRMVVTTKRLDAILSAFPEEVNKARNIIRNDEEEQRDVERQETRPAEAKAPHATLSVASQPPGTAPTEPRPSAGDVRRVETRDPAQRSSPRPAAPAPEARESLTQAPLTQAPRKPSPQPGSVASHARETSPAKSTQSSAGAPRLEARSAAHRLSPWPSSPVTEARGPLSQATRPPSPQLGSDGPVPSPAPSLSKRPVVSAYISRLAASSRSGRGKKRSAEELDRMREHLQRRKLEGKKRVASSS